MEQIAQPLLGPPLHLVKTRITASSHGGTELSVKSEEWMNMANCFYKALNSVRKKYDQEIFIPKTIHYYIWFDQFLNTSLTPLCRAKRLVKATV